MTEKLFDLGDQYDEMLRRGLRLSGEPKQYFLDQRILHLRRELSHIVPRRILDFGCGIGDGSNGLAHAFPDADVVGVDTSQNAIQLATTRYGNDRLAFHLLSELAVMDPFDLCYVNGVFHHIRPDEREQAVKDIRTCLKPGGHLALFENNPLNPGTWLVMSLIPFDKGARKITPWRARKLVLDGGFSRVVTVRYLFFFPRILSFLRATEKLLTIVPLGAQYCVIAMA